MKILEKATVDAAFTQPIGDLDFPAEITTADRDVVDVLRGSARLQVGLRALLNTEDIPARAARTAAPGQGCSTALLVDRTAGITGAIYTQFLPFVTEEAFQMYVDFEQALYASP